MKKLFLFAFIVICLTASTLMAAKFRINRDNSWAGFINGERGAE